VVANAVEKGRLDQLNGIQLRDPRQDSGQRFGRRLFSTALAYARASEAVLFGWDERFEGVVGLVVTTSRLWHGCFRSILPFQ
jgi:hypothetical protein